MMFRTSNTGSDGRHSERFTGVFGIERNVENGSEGADGQSVAGTKRAFIFPTLWNGEVPKDIDEDFYDALSLRNLSQIDFYALYRSMVQAVLARACAELTGRFVLDAGGSETDRRRRLERCYEMEREIGSLRAAIGKQDRFAEQVELNTQLKELESRLARTKAEL